ncbi:unnamed protein product [Rotaria socialis]|uniref:Uncharacterized protein n=1 Tax=Rotaria socialis TaxID=392032 RepID=A0A817XDB8_9BILA|nr:unnamed protein product [Rotaria socialis]
MRRANQHIFVDLSCASKCHNLLSYRRLWDGHHWRVFCRISDCKAQRQGFLYNKFGFCKKKHFTQMAFNKRQYKKLPFQFFFLSSTIKLQEQKQVISVGHDKEKNKKSKQRDLNVVIDELRRSQTISATYSIE